MCQVHSVTLTSHSAAVRCWHAIRRPPPLARIAKRRQIEGCGDQRKNAPTWANLEACPGTRAGPGGVRAARPCGCFSRHHFAVPIPSSRRPGFGNEIGHKHGQRINHG